MTCSEELSNQLQMKSENSARFFNTHWFQNLLGLELNMAGYTKITATHRFIAIFRETKRDSLALILLKGHV